MPWWQNGIIYQIYPRSFADSNGDGIGDLNGIIAKLDYLRDLGVDALWLSPVYPSPDVDFGYDVSDYCAIDAKFGSLADFDRLVEQAQARGIHIVLDLVLNHTSDQHPWFQESRSSRDNPRREWYIWADPRPGGKPPNNWQAAFGGSAWQLDPLTGQCYLHLFAKEQPDVNWHNPQVRAAMLEVFRFWLERGVDGFRLDVVSGYFKHPQLLDNPTRANLPGLGMLTQSHINECNRPEMIPLLQEIRALLDQYSTPGRERYAVGEPYFGAPEAIAAYTGPDRLHAVFNFALTLTPWSARRLGAAIRRWQQALRADAWPCNVFNNHDTSRSATRWRPHLLNLTLLDTATLQYLPYGDTEDDARLKVAAALLLTLRGTPFIYYGEEIGLRDIPIRSKAEVLDPVGKHFWPLLKGRDGCRAPLQWDASANAGFAPPEARPWLPPHPDYPARNVAAQLSDPGSLFNFYRSLIALRRLSPALIAGSFQMVETGARHVLAYLRQDGDQVMLVALNFSPKPQRFSPSGLPGQGPWQVRLSTHRAAGEVLPLSTSFTLQGNEATIVQAGLN